MITAVFHRNQNFELTGFCIKGHAGFADYGKDIVCAAVSAMVCLTVNTLDEVLKCGGCLTHSQSGDLSYSLPDSQSDNSAALAILKGFMLQMQDYAVQYPKNIKICLEDSK